MWVEVVGVVCVLDYLVGDLFGVVVGVFVFGVGVVGVLVGLEVVVEVVVLGVGVVVGVKGVFVF